MSIKISYFLPGKVLMCRQTKCWGYLKIRNMLPGPSMLPDEWKIRVALSSLAVKVWVEILILSIVGDFQRNFSVVV